MDLGNQVQMRRRLSAKHDWKPLTRSEVTAGDSAERQGEGRLVGNPWEGETAHDRCLLPPLPQRRGAWRLPSPRGQRSWPSRHFSPGSNTSPSNARRAQSHCQRHPLGAFAEVNGQGDIPFLTRPKALPPQPGETEKAGRSDKRGHANNMGGLVVPEMSPLHPQAVRAWDTGGWGAG